MIIPLDICGLGIDFDTRHPEFVRRRCAQYLAAAPRTADLVLRAEEEDIAQADRDGVGPMEAELFAMTIPLSERLPALGRLMTHGVAFAIDGRSYIFTAESGVGKSSRAFLYQQYFGADRVSIINGDKPILWFRDDGSVCACGSPWSGKEHLDQNVCLPLGGVCLLRRLDSDPVGGNRIYAATRGETFDFMLHQTFMPAAPAAKMATFGLVEELYNRVPFYHLVTDLSRAGVEATAPTLLHGE